MTNSKNILFVALMAILLGGCKEDLLDTVPNDRLSTDLYWKTERDATLGSNAVYTYLGNADHFFSWDGLSDIGHTSSPDSPHQLILRGEFDPLNSRILSEWRDAYAGIRAANAFMANVDRVQTTNTGLINRLKGEVRVLRAYYYITLAAIYGDVPLVTTEITLEESKQLTRTPVAKVWDFISTEMTEAAALLPNTQTEKGRITKGAALGLKARAMLYAGRNTEAAAAAKQVMDLNVYNIYSSYEKLFTYAAENNTEVIFDIEFVKDTYRNNIFQLMAPYSQLSSQSRYVPNKRLVDAYTMTNGKSINDPTSGFDPRDPYKNRDPRLKFTVFVPGDVLPDNKIYNSRPGSGTNDAVGSTFLATNTGFNVEKYINKEDLPQGSNGGVNIILQRFAEVLLTYAEAKIEANQIDQSVLDAINKVRQRPDVNMPPLTVAASQALMRDIVRQERLVELAFEGLRYIDIRRWRIAETVLPGKMYGMNYVDNNGALKTVEILPWNTLFNKNRDYLWPIPQSERELNPNLTQNPNW
ncbi:RagB/SusD family nutrient uptake outer membrane protein [Daejeonella sp.]|uniref:RagB/SusD family nutrient uptake outer membrane protein n=1 Tax=Daejeonella sp. TaxID=2805397 RepID=UPI0030ECED0C